MFDKYNHFHVGTLCPVKQFIQKHKHINVWATTHIHVAVTLDSGCGAIMALRGGGHPSQCHLIWINPRVSFHLISLHYMGCTSHDDLLSLLLAESVCDGVLDGGAWALMHHWIPERNLQEAWDHQDQMWGVTQSNCHTPIILCCRTKTMEKVKMAGFCKSKENASLIHSKVEPQDTFQVWTYVLLMLTSFTTAAGGHIQNVRSCVASWIHQLPW